MSGGVFPPCLLYCRWCFQKIIITHDWASFNAWIYRYIQRSSVFLSMAVHLRFILLLVFFYYRRHLRLDNKYTNRNKMDCTNEQSKQDTNENRTREIKHKRRKMALNWQLKPQFTSISFTISKLSTDLSRHTNWEYQLITFREYLWWISPKANRIWIYTNSRLQRTREREREREIERKQRQRKREFKR